MRSGMPPRVESKVNELRGVERGDYIITSDNVVSNVFKLFLTLKYLIQTS